MPDINLVGVGWIREEIDGLTDTINRVKPSEFNEAHRYLPESVTSIPGYIRYAVNPFMREIVDCFSIDSPVREVNLKKGVQITYSTVLESGAFYFMAHVKTLPMMYITADKELAAARIENNFIPMLNHSGFAHIVRSSDIGNTHKTGKTKDHIQFEGGGYLVPFGAQNANKMRQASIAVMLKDEIDGWPHTVGKDGDPDALSDDRCSGYWERRKIFRGSTPLIKGASKIQDAFLRGDQRIYIVRCIKCGFPQALRWSTKEGAPGGFKWELEEGTLLLESVRYCCQNCDHPHYEHDKELILSEDSGAEWVPQARPAEPNIRSYHLPAFYSPIGMQPWYKCVGSYLKGFDPVAKRVIDVGKYQVFYNNILAEPFEIQGAKIRFESVSAHRRTVYTMGNIPNEYAEKYSGSKILFLTCTVDVHKSNLAVAVIGWTKGGRSYIIDYTRFYTEGDCAEIDDKTWGELRNVIEEKKYKSDDGFEHGVLFTFIDAGYANETVTTFCSDYTSGVYPILGRDRPGKNQTIKEFSEFTTQLGTIGYKLVVDYYKDRMAPVLRRDWIEEAGEQPRYHFNAPIDIGDKALKELTVEVRRKKTDEKTGAVAYYWHRPGNAPNELWDLLGYGYAAVDVIAWTICIKEFELEEVDWARFWDYVEQNAENFR